MLPSPNHLSLSVRHFRAQFVHVSVSKTILSLWLWLGNQTFWDNLNTKGLRKRKSGLFFVCRFSD